MVVPPRIARCPVDLYRSRKPAKFVGATLVVAPQRGPEGDHKGRPYTAGASPMIASATFSASMRVGKLVLPRGKVGMIEASTTRRPAKPRTRPAGSTTVV